LRKQLWTAWVERGVQQGNLDVAAQILDKRLQVARLHGYKNYAEYQCADRMARTPEAAMELMEKVWDKAKVATNRELEAMQQHVSEQGWTDEYSPQIEPYDWRYLAEKVRQARYSMDEAQFKPYLSLESVRAAMFAVSNRLFGLTYTKREDLVLYHLDVEAYEVREPMPDGSDRLVAVFVLDSFARPYKKSGAWMSEYRTQSRNHASSESANVDSMLGVPIVSNNNNLAKGDPVTLLSLDDARTMFHEFGHAHHGMLSNVTYERLASTNVLTDFVELPSQLFEHWFQDRSVLKEYATHYETGEPIPDELLDRWEVARNFQQGFQTVEYTACALLDMDVHRLDDYRTLDVAHYERDFLERIGMPRGVAMRHRPAHFLHLFASQFYAAGYYVYLWAEVLDKDAFGAFEESGNVFDAATAARLRQYVYGAGNTDAPDALFRKFRGRDPQIEYMLRHKGLL
jgi:peptidyl-dipeptidase Dcp